MADYESQKAIKFLTEKWAGRNCPMCGKGPWTVQDKIFQLTEFHEGNVIIGGPVVPVIPVTCGNCGNTVLLNAIISGSLAPQGEPKKEEPEKKP